MGGHGRYSTQKGRYYVICSGIGYISSKMKQDWVDLQAIFLLVFKNLGDFKVAIGREFVDY